MRYLFLFALITLLTTPVLANDEDPMVNQQITDAVTQADTVDQVNPQVIDAEEPTSALPDDERESIENPEIGIGMSGAGTFADDPSAAVEDETDVNLNYKNESGDQDNGQPIIFHKGEEPDMDLATQTKEDDATAPTAGVTTGGGFAAEETGDNSDASLEEEDDQAVPGPGDLEEQIKEMKEQEGGF